MLRVLCVVVVIFESIGMQEGVVSSVFEVLLIQNIGDFLTEDAVVHVSVRLINYNLANHS